MDKFLLAAVLVVAATAASASDPRSGRDPLDVFVGSGTKLSIPREQLREGGPHVDGIPSLAAPRKVPHTQAGFLGPEDQVLGFAHGGEAVAYPLRILAWHEVVNDTVGGLEIAATFCPLTGSPIVFRRRRGGRVLDFGVSGLLYNSNLVMFDRETGSLWSQLSEEAVSGELLGARLEALRSAYATWGEWAKAHPQTTVLSRETGYSRDYEHDPYAGYGSTPRLYFPIDHSDGRLSPKKRVVGLDLDGKYAALSLDALRRSKAIALRLGAREIALRYSDGPHAFFAGSHGQAEIPVIVAYWFAWSAFHPNTGLFDAASSPGETPP